MAMDRLFRLLRRRPGTSAELIFGIDVGTSYTKVAYVHGPDDTDIRVFQDWTNFGLGKDQHNCVPTIVAYRGPHDLRSKPPDHHGHLTLEQRQDPNLTVYEWFKEDFPGNLRSEQEREPERRRDTRTPFPVAPGNTHTMLLYRYFLEMVHTQLKQSFGPDLKKNRSLTWDEACIEFIFSYPAAWDTMPESFGNIRKQLLMVANDAGFAKTAKYHSVTVELAEPQAAAASSLYDLQQEGYLGNGRQMLVVDSGGGTTDVCVVSLQKNQRDFELDQHLEPTGEHLGSSHIDLAFRGVAQEKLDKLNKRLIPRPDWDTSAMAHSMMFSDDFQASKRDLDSETDDTVFLVPGPSNDMLSPYSPEMLQEHEGAIRHGQITFYRHELCALFDTIIGPGNRSKGGKCSPTIMSLIERARDENKHRFRDGDGDTNQSGGRHRNPDFDIVLLTGGLGENRYLKHRISEFLNTNGNRRTATRPPQVLVSKDCQMSVCKGLVYNRVFQIFASQVAQGSYGVLLPRRPRRGPVNPGDRLYETRPKWLIIEGKPLPSSPRTIRYVFEHEDEPFVMVVEESRRRQRPEKKIEVNLNCNIEALPQDDSAKRYCTVEFVCGIRRVAINLWVDSSDQDAPRRVGDYAPV